MALCRRVGAFKRKSRTKYVGGPSGWDQKSLKVLKTWRRLLRKGPGAMPEHPEGLGSPELCGAVWPTPPSDFGSFFRAAEGAPQSWPPKMRPRSACSRSASSWHPACRCCCWTSPRPPGPAKLLFQRCCPACWWRLWLGMPREMPRERATRASLRPRT